MTDIIDRLQHSADMQYRMSGSADEMLHDAISEIRKLREEMPVAKALGTAVACLTIELGEARSVVAGQAREIADLRVEVKRLHKEHEVACMGGELLRDEIKRMRETLRWYADPRNHFPVERRSPGDPDPAVVFVEEAPIMSDGGMRARKALEAKP